MLKLSKGLLRENGLIVIGGHFEKPMNLKASIQELAYCDDVVSDDFKAILKKGLEITTDIKQKNKDVVKTMSNIQKQGYLGGLVATQMEQATTEKDKLSLLLAYDLITGGASSYVLPNFTGISLIVKKGKKEINGTEYETMTVATQQYSRTLTTYLEKAVKVVKTFVFCDDNSLQGVSLPVNFSVVKKSFELTPSIFDVNEYGEKLMTVLVGSITEFKQHRAENRNATVSELNSLFDDKLKAAIDKLNFSLDNLVSSLEFYK